MASSDEKKKLIYLFFLTKSRESQSLRFSCRKTWSTPSILYFILLFLILFHITYYFYRKNLPLWNDVIICNIFRLTLFVINTSYIWTTKKFFLTERRHYSAIWWFYRSANDKISNKRYLNFIIRLLELFFIVDAREFLNLIDWSLKNKRILWCRQVECWKYQGNVISCNPLALTLVNYLCLLTWYRCS